jgi:KaiC/GvpD/RAD55 family RecA-like ATPase
LNELAILLGVASAGCDDFSRENSKIMSLLFQKATKKSARLRMALIGVAGAGKTYTALSVAQHLGKKVAVIDTERGSASKYSDLFEFDVLEIDTYGPKTYVDAMEAAEEAGYDVLIIDSLSHAWAGKDGALEQVDRACQTFAIQQQLRRVARRFAPT